MEVCSYALFYTPGTRPSDINTDRPTGEQKSLAELREMAECDPDVQDLTNKCKEELIEELWRHHNDKRTSARPNNRAAAADIIATMDRVIDEVGTQETP